MKVSGERIRQNTHKGVIEWSELKSILAKCLTNDIGSISEKHQIKVRIIQETEGSPSYNVEKWRCIVEITEFLED